MEEWLTRCIEVSTAQRVRSFLDEFRRYLPMMIADSPEEAYMTSPKTKQLIANAALSSPEHLETSLAIFNNLPVAVWSKVVDDFTVQLERKLRNSLDSGGSSWLVEPDTDGPELA